MKSRSELMAEADKLIAKEIAQLESKIAQALSQSWDRISWPCGEELYFKLKSELDKSGFRSSWDNGGRASGPSMTVYL